MISCTDFIPVYSELFRYLEAHYGREEVDRYWAAMFRPGAGIPLVDFVKKEGVRGCFTYWSGTLNEEAADFTMYLNEKRGFFQIVMHHCPSKGRLLELTLWEGDKIFLRLLDTDAPFFSLKLKYEGEKLVLAVLNGERIV